ncbi:MAG: hypothetical protein FWF56_05985, partial [Firmicutes bacterium]|nr:hypothetical protein [Bacillota bacterium]
QGTEIQLDYSTLAHKYFELLVQNSNGTVSLDLNNIKRSVVQEEDIQALQEYEKMLNIINQLVEEGTLYIADNGEYLMTDNGVGDRYWDNGGRNDFWVRSELVWFIWVPVGYTWKLNTQAYIIFGAITAIMKAGVSILTEGKYAAIKFIAAFANVAVTLFSDYLTDTVYDILYAIFIVGTAINLVLSLISGGIASVIDIVLKVVAVVVGHVLFDWFGKTFFQRGMDNLGDANNTVTVNCNVIFQDRSWSRSVE